MSNYKKISAVKLALGKRALKSARSLARIPAIKIELKGLSKHFSEDGWGLHFESYREFFEQAGCPRYDFLALLQNYGYRVVHNKKQCSLLIKPEGKRK